MKGTKASLKTRDDRAARLVRAVVGEVVVSS